MLTHLVLGASELVFKQRQQKLEELLAILKGKVNSQKLGNMSHVITWSQTWGWCLHDHWRVILPGAIFSQHQWQQSGDTSGDIKITQRWQQLASGSACLASKSV